MTSDLITAEEARTQTPFIGLAFPVIRVRYAGPTNYRGSRYIATLRGIRATVSYSCELSASENATAAALKVWDKYRAQHAEAFQGDEQTRVFIPGDLSSDAYAFTVIPAGFLAGLES